MPPSAAAAMPPLPRHAAAADAAAASHYAADYADAATPPIFHMPLIFTPISRIADIFLTLLRFRRRRRHLPPPLPPVFFAASHARFRRMPPPFRYFRRYCHFISPPGPASMPLLSLKPPAAAFAADTLAARC